jgi:hypothetical protein
MSRATATKNIKILAVPPNVEVDEDEDKKRKKSGSKKKAKKQTNNINKKKISELDGTHVKNIVYKEVLRI